MAKQRVVYHWSSCVVSISCPACGQRVIVDSEDGELRKCPNEYCQVQFQLKTELVVVLPEILRQSEISQAGAAGDQPIVN